MGQIIVSIGRENGSGGRDIANRIAKKMNVHMYDVRILKDIAEDLDTNLDPGDLLKYEEMPRKTLSSRRVSGHSNSIEEIITEKQFEYIKKLAETGQSFVIVGRCADCILQEFNGLVKIFITADEDKKIKRIATRHNVSETEAEKIIKKSDKGRKQYYEKYSRGHKWGDSRWHDITINSSRLGIDGTADLLYEYITDYNKMIYN